MNTLVTIDIDEEIKKAEKEKAELIDIFLSKCDNINARIKYLRTLKEVVKSGNK